MSRILKGLLETKKDEKGFMPTPRQVPAPPGGHPVPPGYERVKSWGGAYELRKKTTEGEVVSMQARKTPLVVAGSPYDWDVYDLRNNKMVASIIGGDRHDSPLYEVRINSNGMTKETKMLPTYVVTAGPNNNPPYKAFELVAPAEREKIEKSPGPGGTTKLRPDTMDVLGHMAKQTGQGKYYGYDLYLVEEGLDQYELVEKALGAKIMEVDDAMELGYTDWDPEDSSSIVYVGTQKDEGYSAGAVGGAGIGEDTAYAGGMGQGGNAGQSYRKFRPKSSGILEGILNEYDTKTIDSVVERLPKGLTVNNFTHPAFKEFLYQKYYAKVKADWDKLYPFFAQEYKQKHGIKEYKQDPHRIVSGDSEFFDDMLLVIPKGLKPNELYTQAFKEFLYKKFADREWTDFKKNRFTYWDAYQKLGGDKKEKKFFGLFDEEEQIDELKCWTGYKRVPGTKAGEKGSCVKAESSILKGLQTEYKEVPGQRKIEFSKENPPDLYYLYQQFIQRMLNPENTIDPHDWIEKVNNHYGLNYSWKDYQKRGHNDHTDNWQKIINRYILKNKLNENRLIEDKVTDVLSGVGDKEIDSLISAIKNVNEQEDKDLEKILKNLSAADKKKLLAVLTKEKTKRAASPKKKTTSAPKTQKPKIDKSKPMVYRDGKLVPYEPELNKPKKSKLGPILLSLLGLVGGYNLIGGSDPQTPQQTTAQTAQSDEKKIEPPAVRKSEPKTSTAEQRAAKFLADSPYSVSRFIKQNAFDEDSLKFRNWQGYLVPIGGNKNSEGAHLVTTGEYNGKNRLGAYVGYKSFIASIDPDTGEVQKFYTEDDPNYVIALSLIRQDNVISRKLYGPN